MNVKADDLTQVITEAFSFDVVKLPLYAPDNQPTGIYGLFRDDLTGKDALVGSGSVTNRYMPCLLYTSPSPRDGLLSRMPSSA